MSLPYDSIVTPTQQLMVAKLLANMEYLASLEERLAAAEARLLMFTPLMPFKQKIIAIGNWDMQGVDTKELTHGLVYTNILDIQAFIIPDSGSGAQIRSFFPDGSIHYNSNLITLRKTDSGAFDTVSYNDTATARGDVIITYRSGLT